MLYENYYIPPLSLSFIIVCTLQIGLANPSFAADEKAPENTSLNVPSLNAPSPP